MRSHGAARCFLLPALAALLAACAGTPEQATAWHGKLTNGSEFGVTVGGGAAGVPDIMWAEGYGFEGAVICAGEERALLGCAVGDEILSFQPLEPGKKGHIYLKVENGRIAEIDWALTPVAFSEG